MADPFAPLPALPDEGPTDEDLGSLRNAATWAKTFDASTARLPRDKQNLALRSRHHRDVEDYAAAVEARRAAAQEERLMRDRDAANYVLRSRAMDMKDRMDRFSIAERMEKLDNAAKGLDSLIESRIATADAAKHRRERDLAETKRKAEVTAAADLFHTIIANSPFVRGTPEDDDHILRALETNPRAEEDMTVKGLVAKARTAQAGRVKTAETAEQRAETERRAAAMGMRPKGITATGATTFSAPTPPKPAKTRIQEIDAELPKLEKEWRTEEAKIVAKTKAGEPLPNPIVEPAIEALRKERAQLVAEAPERTATNPQTGEKVVFRNGAWQPLTQ